MNAEARSAVAVEPSDAAERRTALDVRRSFIVQAPAGSGKTSLLVARMLTLLAHVEEPEQILALTFTRKAAGEMRERVIAALAAAARDEPVSRPDERQLRLLARAALDNDRLRGWTLLAQPQRLSLLTIDGLAARLAHRLPVTALLGAPMGIDEDHETRYREAALAVLQAEPPALDRLLLQVGNRLGAAADLLARLLAKREQWLRYGWPALDPDDLREQVTTMYERHVAARLADCVAALAPVHRRELVAIAATAACYRRGLALESEASALDPERIPGTAAADIEHWQALVRLCLTSAGKLRRQVDRRGGFPTNAQDAATLGCTAAELKAHKARMLELLAALDDGGATEAVLVGLLKLPAVGYDDDDWALLHELIAALPALRVELFERFREHGGVDFTEMALRARYALGTEAAPSDLALALDAGVRHLLVDEFQDTSQTQFELFEALVAGWQPEDGRTVFAVGDPMQSIYGFREADVSLFRQAAERGLGPVALVPLRLDANFRSVPAVVEWGNRHFARLFPSRPDAIRAAVPFSASAPMLDGPGAVALHGLLDADATAEAARVLDLIRHALAATADGQIAVLVRVRSHAREIFRALDDAAIEYASIAMDPLGERPVVGDLLSLALALRYPHDRLHWLAVLRAPWCGLTLDDLHRLARGLPRHAAIFDRLGDAAVLATLSDDGRMRAERLHAVLLPAVRRARRDPLIPWLEASWLALGGPAVYARPADRAAVKRALDTLEALDGAGRLREASDFRAALDRLYAEPVDDGTTRVQVMTMHHAKGLEFDTVILPGLHRTGRQDEPPALDWMESTLDGEPQLLLAPIGERGDGRHPIGQLIADMREARRDAESLRLLYVACTRARRALHLVACLPAPNASGEVRPGARSLLASLWPTCASGFNLAVDESVEASAEAPRVSPDIDRRASAVAAATAPESRIVSLRRLPGDWHPPARDLYTWPDRPSEPVVAADFPTFEWAGPLARDVGTVVHGQLQRLASAYLDADAQVRIAARARSQLRQLGVPDAALDAATRRVVEAVEQTCADPRGRWIFDPSHRAIACEWALSAAFDGTVRRVVVDRSFIDRDDVRWVIDFKTGDHAGGKLDTFLDRELERYRAQLECYVEVVGRLDARPVRAGLYFPLLQAWRTLPG